MQEFVLFKIRMVLIDLKSKYFLIYKKVLSKSKYVDNLSSILKSFSLFIKNSCREKYRTILCSCFPVLCTIYAIFARKLYCPLFGQFLAFYAGAKITVHLSSFGDVLNVLTTNKKDYHDVTEVVGKKRPILMFWKSIYFFVNVHFLPSKQSPSYLSISCTYAGASSNS